MTMTLFDLPPEVPTAAPIAAAPLPTREFPHVGRRLTRAEMVAAVHDTEIDLVIEGVHIPAHLNVRMRAEFDTACWRYEPPHEVTMGDRLLGRATVTDPALVHEYVGRIYEHELAHALDTEPDLAGVGRALAAATGVSIPAPVSSPRPTSLAGLAASIAASQQAQALWSLLNLFEDARIEDRWRTRRHRPFGWARYEGVPLAPATTPSVAFFHLIHGEGTIVTVPAPGDALVAEHTTAVAAAVRYYTRCLAAEDTLAVVSIVADWVREFGLPESQPPQGLGDLAIAIALALGGTVTLPDGTTISSADLADAPVVSIRAEAEPDSEPSTTGAPETDWLGSFGDTSGREGRGVSFGDEDAPLPLRTIERLAGRLMLMFGDEHSHEASWSPSRRLNLRGIPSGGAPFRQAVLESAGVLRIGFIVDCSGSMNGSHIDEARLVIAALSILARQGLVEGHVILSSVEGRDACYTRMPLPVPNHVTARIVAEGAAEGLASAIENNLRILATCHLVLVFSDGRITDTPVNKAALKAAGVQPIGCYAGDPDAADNLARWFSPVLVAPNAEGMVELIVRSQLTRRRV